MKTRWHPKEKWRYAHRSREDSEGGCTPAGGSGGSTQDQRTEEDFKHRVRELLLRIEGHLDRIDQRLDRIEGRGEGPSGDRGGRGQGRGEGRGRRGRGG
jgi:hypothetical protein